MAPMTTVVQFRPIKKREPRPRGRPDRKIATFLPIPLTAARQHIATEELPQNLKPQARRTFLVSTGHRADDSGGLGAPADVVT